MCALVLRWNPGTIVKINVDPTITTAPKSARWSNIEFTIDAPGLSSDASFGTTVSYKQGGTAKPLLRLNGLGHDIYGYHSYDFETRKYTPVTQKKPVQPWGWGDTKIKWQQ